MRSVFGDAPAMTTEQTCLDPFALRVLRVLYELARCDRPAHAGALAAELGVARTLAASALVRLDAEGLVRAEHARLTMRGLVLAARLEPMLLTASCRPANPQLVPGRAMRGLHKVRIARVPSRLPLGWERVTGA
jgi:hypothetical protein